MALLPSGGDLGEGWSNRVTSLVDRGTATTDYFDPGVREPSRAAIRSNVPDRGAFCAVSYFRDGRFVFDAWLRRPASTNSAEAEWHQLRHAPLIPQLSDGKVAKRSIRQIGDLEAVLYEDGGRTLWLASGGWILNLNLPSKMPMTEVFRIAEVFARRLGSGPLASARRP